jgi:hypothetical protein
MRVELRGNCAALQGGDGDDVAHSSIRSSQRSTPRARHQYSRTLSVLFALAATFIAGLVLHVLVKRSKLHPSHALNVIRSVAIIVGGRHRFGRRLAVADHPLARSRELGDYTFLSDTLFWQTDFLKAWSEVECVAMGGGFRGSRIGELAISRCALLLRADEIPIDVEMIAQ